MTAGLAEAVRRAPEQRYQRAVLTLLRRRDRLTDQQVRALVALLAGVRRQVVADLASLAGASGFEAFRLSSLRDAIDRAAFDLATQHARLLGDALLQAWEQGAAFQPTALSNARIDLGTLDISTAPLAIVQAVGLDLVTRVSDEFRVKAKRVVTLGVMGATAPHLVMREVGDLLRTQPGRDGRLGSIASQAERVVRTEMMTAFNLAGQQRAARIAESAPGLKKWWNATADQRTRPAHWTAEQRYQPGGSEGPIPHGQDFIVGGERCSGPHDPRLSARNRINCRCVLMLHNDDWFEGE